MSDEPGKHDEDPVEPSLPPVDEDGVRELYVRHQREERQRRKEEERAKKDAQPATYRNALPGETIGQYKARVRAQMARGREEASASEEENLRKAAARKKARGSGEVDLAADVLWVYENIDLADKDRIGVPSQGARGLLRWAKKDEANRKQFYATMMPKALVVQEAREKAAREKKRKKSAEEKKKQSVAKDLPLAEVEEMLKGFAGQETEEKPKGGD